MFLKALEPHCGGQTPCLSHCVRQILRLIYNKSTGAISMSDSAPLRTEISPCCGQIPSPDSSEGCRTCRRNQEEPEREEVWLQSDFSSPPRCREARHDTGTHSWCGPSSDCQYKDLVHQCVDRHRVHPPPEQFGRTRQMNRSLTSCESPLGWSDQ